ncbi:NEM1 [[Candida] subhashii]|uniref:NEM1 n=1 Tax=[Candida] subhashii TaxID=561895 RepID=A0A8J5V049_9ASCO|nr:NEM1 [[Candida] subhashii]KAG7665255.1 NEM1 [[Candida] subhashii]
MNSIKVLVSSIDNIIPTNFGYDIPPVIDADISDDKYGQDIEVTTETQQDEDEEEVEDSDGSINLTQDSNNATDLSTGKEADEIESDDIPQPPIPFLYSFLLGLWDIIYFFPNYLIIKPTIFIYFVVTFPLRLVLKQLGIGDSDSKSPTIGAPDAPIADEEDEDEDDELVTRAKPSPRVTESSKSTSQNESNDYDEKTEILSKENLISNSLKSPSEFSKYLIPPPQRLYPLSRNPDKKRNKKILILDLDETLIHSLSPGSPRSFSAASHSKQIEIKLNNISSLYYVHKRPYCDYFLSEASKWFELQIFTASVKEYADPIINWLEGDILDRTTKRDKSDPNWIPPKIFTKRYYRNDCTYRPGVGYIKDLSKFVKDEELKNVLILDNSPISYALHEDNAVGIEGWINDHSDRDLLNLLPMLHSLSLCIDVRFIMGLKKGEKVFES